MVSEAAEVWDRPRVLRLAADTAARQAALRVPGTAWIGTGRSGAQVWGRCRGSGATPYDVVLDVDAARWLCGCPSRKVPCKHALALLLRWSDGLVDAHEPPEFVARRLGAPAVATPARPAGELADPAAAAARAAARTERVAGGLDELSTWIGDQVRTGLAGLERGGWSAVDTVAARMVDAQAPGVAGLLRRIPGELGREGWPERVLEQLAALHLLVQAHRRIDTLPADLAATVRGHVGYPVSRADVLAGPAVEDEWLAVGQLDTVESKLESRRVWLWGRHSRRWALWLTFVPPGGAPDTTVVLGDRFVGRLHFYPGAGQLRAVVGEPTAADPALAHRGEPWPPEDGLGTARRRFADLLAADPWAARLPVLLRAAPVPPDGDAGWRLRDADGICCPLLVGGAEPWPLVAQGRGRTVAVMAEWTAEGARPLAVLGAAGTGAAVLRAA
ncbi:SWIM zinc finger [Friedmanniella luteola]|uniref:SWIM zinc finger n=1 Tax=Friedmanniella luteola TaxID=546871 RepID=A0A1H1VXI6_9ACTN|nr:SWIM zinc finger family protein [Friedmanniella luteola]SDS88966.1 SWIM zinc finger [Friedmanniella luteola]